MRKVVMSIMDQVKKNLREWYTLAADRTGEMAKISVRMYDKYGISREIERQLSELGSYVYHAVEDGRTEFSGDAEFQSWIDRIKSQEKDLEAKVEEIEEIRIQRQQKQEAREQEEAAAAAQAAAAGESAMPDENVAPVVNDDEPVAAAEVLLTEPAVSEPEGEEIPEMAAEEGAPLPTPDEDETRDQ